MTLEKQIQVLKETVALQKELIQSQSTFIMLDKGLAIPEAQLEKASDVMAASTGLISPPDGEDWKANVYYASGTVVDFTGIKYLCVTSHISQTDWTPDVTPALWAVMKEEYAEWQQPAGAHDAYQTGDKVTYQGKKWVSAVDNNVWAPGSYGWDEIH